jgi:DNA-damage-inducible protein D
MNQDLILFGPHKDFETIKHLDEDGVEFWNARELMPLLGYDHWQKAEDVIGRAARACVNSGQVVDNHFNRTVKMVKIGINTVREVKDWKLDRYACYLIAQNGDPNKSEVAQAQSYFAIQTRKQELSGQISAEQKRLFIRNKVKEENKNLASTAKRAGVTKFGSFNDAGYLGLYGMNVRDIEQHKGIKKGELLDRAGSTELAANLFRITQTDEKIRTQNIRGQDEASQTHFIVGSKVRQTIKEIGGTMPEKLPTEKHIKEIKENLKKLGKNK